MSRPFPGPTFVLPIAICNYMEAYAAIQSVAMDWSADLVNTIDITNPGCRHNCHTTEVFSGSASGSATWTRIPGTQHFNGHDNAFHLWTDSCCSGCIGHWEVSTVTSPDSADGHPDFGQRFPDVGIATETITGTGPSGSGCTFSETDTDTLGITVGFSIIFRDDPSDSTPTRKLCQARILAAIGGGAFGGFLSSSFQFDSGWIAIGDLIGTHTFTSMPPSPTTTTTSCPPNPWSQIITSTDSSSYIMTITIS